MVIAYFRWYLAVENNLPKIRLPSKIGLFLAVYGGRRKWINFQCQLLSAVIRNNFWRLFSKKPPKIPWPSKIILGYFRRFLLSREKYYWPFLAVLPSCQKLIYARGSTHPHFNFTPVLNWKITHIYILHMYIWHIYISTYIFIYIYTHTHIYTYICTYIHM
jgi:hypothetical protein